jgi:DNA repair protein RecO (recombination protein O)
VLCPTCRLVERDAIPLSLTALKVLRFIQTRDLPQVRQLALSADAHQEIERLLLRYLTHVLERQLKSPEFLELVRGYNPMVAVSG